MLLDYNGKRESSDRTKLKWLNYTLEKKKKKEYNGEIGLSLKVYCNSMYIPIS